MAKKTLEKVINLDSILFNCRDILRVAKNLGFFFEKRDMMLTLIFLRFIGEKYEDGIVINEKCKKLAKKVKKIIDTKSSFADLFNNQNIGDQLKLDIKVCLIKNGYPPQYSHDVFTKGYRTSGEL